MRAKIKTEMDDFKESFDRAQLGSMQEMSKQIKALENKHQAAHDYQVKVDNEQTEQIKDEFGQINLLKEKIVLDEEQIKTLKEKITQDEGQITTLKDDLKEMKENMAALKAN